MIAALLRRLCLAPLPPLSYAIAASISWISINSQFGADWHYGLYFLPYFAVCSAVLLTPYIPLLYFLKTTPIFSFFALFLCLAFSISFPGLRAILYTQATTFFALNDPGLRVIFGRITTHSYFSADFFLCIIIFLSITFLLIARHTINRKSVKFLEIFSTLTYMLWPLLFFLLTYTNGLLESAICSLPSIFILAYLERKHFAQ